MTFSNVSFGDVTDNFDKKQPNEKKDKENIGIMGRKE